MSRISRLFLVLVFGVVWEAIVPACAETIVLDGVETWRIVLTPRRGRFVGTGSLSDYRNASFTQRIVERSASRVIVERTNVLTALSSTASMSKAPAYPTAPELKINVTSSIDERLLDLAENLAKGTSLQVEYVDAVMFWVKDHVEWADVEANDPVSVLRTGRGTCAGFCAVAVTLLRARGIPARPVGVQTLKHPSWNPGAHAEVEVWYSDAGWVSYDPQRHLHHSPYPRVWLGSNDGSVDGSFSSDNRMLYDASEFFSRNDYDVRYERLSSTIRPVAIGKQPKVNDFIARGDGALVTRPSMSGVISDGFGRPSRLEHVFYRLSQSGAFTGVPLMDGAYVIPNDNDGGTLYYDEDGWVIRWDFPGFGAGNRTTHDVRFDATDAIIHRGRRNGESKWFFEQNSYYTFKCGPDGMLRLHVNRKKEMYRVDDVVYVYSGERWTPRQ